MFRKTQEEWEECVALIDRWQSGEITSEQHDEAHRELEARIRERVFTKGVVVRPERAMAR